jgi:hypothetical protein
MLEAAPCAVTYDQPYRERQRALGGMRDGREYAVPVCYRFVT